MIFLLDFYDISAGLLWGFYWIPLDLFLWISMIFLWDFYGISIGSPWWFFGIEWASAQVPPTPLYLGGTVGREREKRERERERQSGRGRDGWMDGWIDGWMDG